MKNTILILLVLAIVLLGFRITNLQKKILEYESDAEQVSVLLGGADKVQGYTCGVLTPGLASSLLETEVDKMFDQGPTTATQPFNEDQESIFWSDSCRYQSQNNSNKYVEFYIASFQTNVDAYNAFPDFFKQVNDNVIIDSYGIGSSLVYDNGTYFLLNGTKIIQVAASNGSPSELEEFSRQVFDRLISN